MLGPLQSATSNYKLDLVAKAFKMFIRKDIIDDIIIDIMAE